MNALLRRRGMMQKEDRPSAFAPGSYTSSELSGGVNTVHPDGSIENTNGRLLYYVTIPITKPVPFKTGDVITFAQDRAYTSLIHYRYVQINNSSGMYLINNKNVYNYASVSVTADRDGVINALYFGNSSSGQRGRVRPIIQINGKTVIGA